MTAGGTEKEENEEKENTMSELTTAFRDPGGPAPGSRAPVWAALADDTGATTAEYAITTLAACGFAALLVGLLSSGEVRELLFSIIQRALAMGG